MDRKRRILLLVGAFLLFLAVGAGIYRKGTGISAAAYALDHAANEGRYRLPQVPSEQPAKSREAIRVQINGAPEADRTGRCNLMAGNPPENVCDLCVTVRLDESGQGLYRSGVLKPGEREVYVMLVPVPEPGSHRATAEFAVLDKENGEVTGMVEAGITIVVAD